MIFTKIPIFFFFNNIAFWGVLKKRSADPDFLLAFIFIFLFRKKQSKTVIYLLLLYPERNFKASKTL